MDWYNLNNLPSDEEMAFDHAEDIQLLKKYLKENTPLPFT
jgi:hypothetical protein